MEIQYSDELIYDPHRYYVTLISPGLLTADPKKLREQPKHAYLNIVSLKNIPKHMYRIYFTESENRLKNEENMTVHKTFYLQNFKEQNKFIVHKLRKYKKIIDGIRYYCIDNFEQLLTDCKNAIELYAKQCKDPNIAGRFRYEKQIIYNPIR